MGEAASAEIDRPKATDEVLSGEGRGRVVGRVALTGAEAHEAQAMLGRIRPISYDIVSMVADGFPRPAILEKLKLSDDKLDEYHQETLTQLDVATAEEAVTTILDLLKACGLEIDYQPQTPPSPEPPQTDSSLAEALLLKFESLTPSEVKALIYVCNGLDNKKIAEALQIGVQTVKFHLSNIYRKLDVPNRTAALSLAAKSGFLETVSGQDIA